MIVLYDLHSPPPSMTSVVDISASVDGPPPKLVHIGTGGGILVCDLTTGGGSRVSRYSAQTSGSDQATTLNDRLANAIRQIALLADLQSDWDGDGAPAPSPVAIRRATEIAAHAYRTPDEVDPDAIGGIALWFYGNDGRKVMIGVRNDGRAVVCSYHPSSSIPEVKTLRDAVSAAALVRTSVGP